MKEIKAIIFDMDGVLIDSERIVTKCWTIIGKEHFLEDMESAIKDCVGLNKQDTKDYMAKKYGDQFSYDQFAVQVRQMFQDEVKKEGLPLKTGVREILEYFKNENYRIGLASSSRRETVREHMITNGLMEYFQVVVTGDMVIHSKPEPEIYLRACEEIGVSPEYCAAIEDSPNGIKSAYAANMKTIMVPDMILPTPELRKMIDLEFYDLLEVRNFFQNFRSS